MGECPPPEAELDQTVSQGQQSLLPQAGSPFWPPDLSTVMRRENKSPAIGSALPNRLQLSSLWDSGKSLSSADALSRPVTPLLS